MELVNISENYNKYISKSMKSEGMLAVKIIEIDRQHTPTPRLCLSRAKRVDKDS